MSTVFYDFGFAAEDLDNYSVCVKEGKSIRKLVKPEELTTKLLVFVNHIHPSYTDVKENVVFKGERVRYAYVNVGYR